MSALQADLTTNSYDAPLLINPKEKCVVMYCHSAYTCEQLRLSQVFFALHFSFFVVFE